MSHTTTSWQRQKAILRRQQQARFRSRPSSVDRTGRAIVLMQGPYASRVKNATKAIRYMFLVATTKSFRMPAVSLNHDKLILILSVSYTLNLYSRRIKQTDKHLPQLFMSPSNWFLSFISTSFIHSHSIGADIAKTLKCQILVSSLPG